MDISEAKKRIEQGGITIVDIRAADAYQESHIKNAKNISSEGQLSEFLNSVNKRNPVLCYCYHGISSQQAVGFLLSKGFKEVHSLDGGFEAWKLEGPVVFE